MVFIKNLPHGFFEEQLTKYFRQFGEVTRLRLARSKKTGGSKGYAFVEFEFPEVANYAADAMNNYLMFQKIVKAQSIPPEKQRYNYFKSKLRKVVNKAGKEIYISGDTIRVNKKVKQYNDNSDASYQKKTASAMKALKKANEKFAALGVEVDIALKPKVVSAKSTKGKIVEEEGKLLLNNKKGKKNEVPPKKAKIELKQLLEETLPEEGSDDDEDFNIEDDNDSVSSNEKSYGIVDSEPEEEEEHLIELRNKKKVKPTNKLDNLIKKKPLAGGVQKYNKKSIKDTKKVTSAAKTVLKKGAVAEIVAKGNVKTVKKADLKKKKGGGKKKVLA